ncbi:CUB and zona pellucida-like domain-containing protein 1 [Anomaloglossus baeobatrachus]|uniref:CUB and zona pellucida-like domain-containing protein 1 n=1 Tax=Anomaloglossus baeobatrachus TaxID=238106 RepID=UPI003F4FE7A4
MKNSQSCQASSLSVYDGTPLQSTLLGDLCSTSSRDFFSSSNRISIVYSSSDKKSGLVFSATYYSTFTNNQNVSLSCYSDYMVVWVSLSFLQSLEYSPDQVFLNDPQCRPQVVSDWLEFNINYDGCLTIKQVENDTISYINTLVTDSSDTIYTYKRNICLKVKCRLSQETVVEGMYSADVKIKNTLVQYGLFTAELIFFQSSSFIQSVNEYPYNVEVNQYLYLQITVHTSDPTMVIFLDTCVESTNELEFTRNVYYIIRNG